MLYTLFLFAWLLRLWVNLSIFLKVEKSTLHFKNISLEFGQDCSSYTGGFEVNRDCSGDTIHVHLEAGHDLSFNYSFSFSGFFTLLNVRLEKVTVEDAIWRLVTTQLLHISYTTPVHLYK